MTRWLHGRLWSLYWKLRDHFAEKGAALGGCACCGSFWRLRWQPSMTCYTHREGEPDPNAPRWYCEPCALDYEEHMQAMWDEYHYSRGV